MAIRTLSKELQQKVEDNMKEVPNRRNNDINHIKDWLLKQHHLNTEKDDQIILNFLRYAKFSLAKAKQKIDSFYTFKTIMPDVFENRDPFSPAMADILNQGVFSVIMGNAKSLLPVVIVVRWGRVNPDIVTVIDVIKMQFILVHIVMNMSDTIIINGLHVFEDPDGFSMKLLPQFTPAVLKKYLTCAQHVYPIRVLGIHILNCPSVLHPIMNLSKTFLKEKMKNRFHVYDDKNIIDKFDDLPECIIPKEYGGSGGSLDALAAEWKEEVESHRDWLAEDYKYRSDETKRPGKPKTAEELFGLEGSFRNLALD